MADLIIAYRQDLIDIADAVRQKTGKTELMSLNHIRDAIQNITSSQNGSDVAFGSNDATQFEYYAISAEVLNAIAAEVKKMAGRTILMTPEEILYWLRKVQYIPQGFAQSIQSIANGSDASGTIPTVVRGAASSVQPIYNTSTAMGSIVESV